MKYKHPHYVDSPLTLAKLFANYGEFKTFQWRYQRCGDFYRYLSAGGFSHDEMNSLFANDIDDLWEMFYEDTK